MSCHQIEISTSAVLAARKLFNHLGIVHLEAAGFSEDEIRSFGELYLEIKEQCEEIEIGMHD